MRHLRSVSYGFVGILYSRRLILLYSNHLEGRQTVENHHVHIGTRRTHVMTSSISIFSRFLFSQKQVCPRKSRKFAPSENFPLYGISNGSHGARGARGGLLYPCHFTTTRTKSSGHDKEMDVSAFSCAGVTKGGFYLVELLC